MRSCYFSNAAGVPAENAQKIRSMIRRVYGGDTNLLAVNEVLADIDTILNRVQQGPTPYATAVIGKWHVSGSRAAPTAPTAEARAEVGADRC
jgi:hypothetical protein